MKTEKYSNLDSALPSLNSVLKEAVQVGTLEIRAVDKMCSKFLKAAEKHPELGESEFVIYSPYIRKADHPFEHFVFLDKCGSSLCYISGSEMELHGLLDSCKGLRLSEDFLREHAGKEP